MFHLALKTVELCVLVVREECLPSMTTPTRLSRKDGSSSVKTVITHLWKVLEENIRILQSRSYDLRAEHSREWKTLSSILTRTKGHLSCHAQDSLVGEPGYVKALDSFP